MTSNTELAAKERAAHDTGTHDANRLKLKRVFDHVYGSPNGVREQADFETLAEQHMTGARVLEVGCGTGWNSPRFLRLGAASVDGVDLSQRLLDEARQYANARARFFLHDIHDPFPGEYDLILGRAVLHHVNFRHVLRQLYNETLRPGGTMIFMEPLGDGLLSRAYWALGSSLHTPDERPFYAKDIAWLKGAFVGFEVLPYGYTSFAMCPVSAMLFRSPDNALLRACDRFDTWLARHVPLLTTRFRSAIFVIRKPG
ncbi:MAG: class I SAM-dependent methyltransferase [Acetobacteraceae bacterium]|nr:class I SAM-dependent methyltransferase [Acetobacteraceae bacterium]